MAAADSSLFQQLFGNANQWFRGTPERALDQAYDAALKIRSLENEHFQGEKISPESHPEYSDRALSYFNSELKKYLKIIQTRLIVFNASRSVLGWSEQINPSSGINLELEQKVTSNGSLPHPKIVSAICEKLDYIDAVVSRYQSPDFSVNSSTYSLENSLSSTATENPRNSTLNHGSENKNFLNNNPPPISKKKTKMGFKNKSSTRVLPRSLLRTLSRIKQELRPGSESEIIESYKQTQKRTLESVRFILLLILIPLLTQQLAKNFVVGPIVDRVFTNKEQTPIFINVDMEEEAFIELKQYEERLRFKALISKAPPLTSEELDEKLKEKAQEIAEEYKGDSGGAIKNVFADIISVLMFAGILVYNRSEVETLKSFMGDLIYGLSDSAKAFIIILSTDMFVGFHSPHGWEVILESTARHFGLPENREFNFLFIATFPVILDAVFKYWIFRYLNRSSPSAVSTYKTMNE
ncbi:proton extrusion protein PcxA [Planktothrix paucivesiculata]|uniref:Proton extrusion protein PxcA n=1 Tax=Planktothrix paucivesiculata PCC 9631 TaxID=671071 RepID=A0A7Z9BZL0_9CYAN|nr:proton extrusion protein PcxA [Planktothrix paucivesiculata]VXD24313.1 Proton extrusion protein PcxA [Planktothrix paucivesiculata PCC 9631]